jgi:hypothetical protein
MSGRIGCLAIAAAIAFGGCAGRVRAPAREPAAAPVAVASPPSRKRTEREIRAGFEASGRATPHLPMLADEAAHKAMPTLFKGRAMPNLVLVGGHQPRTMEALLAFAKQMRTEGDLDGRLLNDVFWAVSSANDCFY